MNDLSSNPELPIKAAKTSVLSEAHNDRNSLTVVTDAVTVVMTSTPRLSSQRCSMRLPTGVIIERRIWPE